MHFIVLDNCDMTHKCTCSFCKTHDLYRWSKINECGCGCHNDENAIVGHESLCCPYPNGKKINNPYTDLDPSKRYMAILQLLEEDADKEMQTYDKQRMEKLKLKHKHDFKKR